VGEDVAGVGRTELELVDWRRRVAALYAAVRSETDPEAAHGLWRAGRDALFREHPQSPLPAGSPLRETGLPYWSYDETFRLEVALTPVPEGTRTLELPSGETGTTLLRAAGRVDLPGPVGGTLTVWWLEQYAGGIFLPVRDATAGDPRPGAASYGGGRYLLDTAKGADLGTRDGRLVVDLNFLYHPSCRYDDAWLCPLAPPENTLAVRVEAGERMS